MGSMTKQTLFFKHKPLFGLDIGNGSLKVMQLTPESVKLGQPQLLGYGSTKFPPEAVKDGVVIKPEIVAESLLQLFRQNLVGDITTRRVAMAIPAYRAFTRAISLPGLKPKEIRDAVELEAEQYIPLPLEELYLDYTVLQAQQDSTEVFAVAVPRKIVDSYLELASLAGLDVMAIETTLGGGSRLFGVDKQSDVPSVIIDFGSLSSDISIFDKQVLVTGTVQGGGSIFTEKIKNKLGVTETEAGIIKNKYGLALSKKQAEIREALDPTLQQIVKEIRRMIRYYEERYGTERPINQVITLGGGANMPGLTDYLTNALRLPVRACEPWQYLHNQDLQSPSAADRPMYSTVAGLALIKPHEVFTS